MNQSENVTMFNDLCLFAPAELIGDKYLVGTGGHAHGQSPIYQQRDHHFRGSAFQQKWRARKFCLGRPVPVADGKTFTPLPGVNAGK